MSEASRPAPLDELTETVSPISVSPLEEDLETMSPLRNVHRFYQGALKKWSHYPYLPSREDFTDLRPKEAPESQDADTDGSVESPSSSPVTGDENIQKSDPNTFLHIASREGIHETLRDFDNGRVTFREYGNISNFLLTVTPHISLSSNQISAISLSNLWSFYDETDFEIPICSSTESLLTTLYYFPLLSSFNIRDTQNNEVLSFSEELPPLERPLFFEKIAELSQKDQFSRLNSLCVADIDPESYYSVLWMPIHCHSHSPQKSAGVFLTYHTLHPSKLNADFPVANRLPAEATDIPQTFDNLDRANKEEISVYYCNCAGYIPFRAQSETWYRTEKRGIYRAPLQLFIAAYTLAHSSSFASTDNDLKYYLSHDKGLAEFLQKSVSGGEINV